MSIKLRFCVRCGKETEKLEDGLCADCYLGLRGISLPKKIVVEACPNCQMLCWHGLWCEPAEKLDYYFLQELMSKTEVPEGVEIEDIKILRQGLEGRVKVRLSVLGKSFEQEYDLSLVLKDKRCLSCTRLKARTHQAIIQVRGEQIDEMLGVVERYKTYIIKIEKQKTGVDVYLASKTAAEHLAHELRGSFKLWMKRSGQQYGWDQTKNRPKYRLVILLKEK